MSGISRSLKPSVTKTHEAKAFRNDARAKVTGRAQYCDDYVFPRMVHAVPVYSDRVRARILGINPAAALSMPGVLKVLTADDIPGKVRFGQIDHDLPLLAQEEIRYAGEPYALVVAETRDQALKAAEQVELSAEDLEPIFHPDAALEPDAPLLRAVGEDNLVCHHKVRRGDAEAALERANL